MGAGLLGNGDTDWKRVREHVDAQRVGLRTRLTIASPTLSML